MFLPRGRPLAVALAACLLALSCGGGSSGTTSPVAVAPTPVPSGCPLGMGSHDATCARGESRLLPQVEGAIDLLVQQKPGLFDLTQDELPGWHHYKVLQPEAYLDGVVANLRAAGLCAQRDPDDGNNERIQVKSTNEYSEDFDILVSTGYMRRGTGAYRETCTPSSFPVERTADEPPLDSGCGKPFPPPVSRINCKVYLYGAQFYTLDSTPLVGPDCAYCASIGIPDQCFCPVRRHGAADRLACENWRVGTAKDTGRPGPTWTKEDAGYCTGRAAGCENHPDNQYQLRVYDPGRYRVEAENGVSCTVEVKY
jgi:hypothetical protein